MQGSSERWNFWISVFFLFFESLLPCRTAASDENSSYCASLSVCGCASVCLFSLSTGLCWRMYFFFHGSLLENVLMLGHDFVPREHLVYLLFTYCYGQLVFVSKTQKQKNWQKPAARPWFCPKRALGEAELILKNIITSDTLILKKHLKQCHYIWYINVSDVMIL